MVDVGADGQTVVKDQLGGVLGKAHAARQVLKRDQHGVAFLKEALQKPALACVGLGIGLKQAVDGLVATRVQAGIEQAAVIVEHQRQVGRPGLVQVTLGQEHRAAKRKRQVVFEDAVAGTPVLGVGEVDQAVVAGLGAKREVVHIAAQSAGDLHVVSNPLKTGVWMLRFYTCDAIPGSTTQWHQESYSTAIGCQMRSSMLQCKVFASANAEDTEARRRSSWFCS